MRLRADAVFAMMSLLCASAGVTIGTARGTKSAAEGGGSTGGGSLGQAIETHENPHAGTTRARSGDQTRPRLGIQGPNWPLHAGIRNFSIIARQRPIGVDVDHLGRDGAERRHEVV